MNQLYKRQAQLTIYFKDGTKKVSKPLSCGYRYDEVPLPIKQTYDDWKEFLPQFGFNDGYEGEKTLFKRRIYVNEYLFFRDKIFKDQFEKAVYDIEYKVISPIDYPEMSYLEEKLPFQQYMELIFDQRLKLENILRDRR